MSMAASLEARSPFLDHVLVEFAATVPASLKLRRGVGKYLLKKAMEGRLPHEIIHRRKHGFGVPTGSWFRGSLREFLTDTLLSARSLRRGLLHAPAVRRLVDEHLSGLRDHGQALWTLVMLEAWACAFLDASPT
jgi:asparagine synthase (glutamine-hydrolysing)